MVLRPSWCFVLPAHYRRQLRTLFPAAVGGNIGENVQLLVERNLLATHLGFGPLGLYVHSQQYRAMAQWCVKAVGRTIWPVTLADARDDRDFQLTASAWNLAFTALGIGGIFFALFGNEFVAALTHGKFTAAAPLVAGWLAVLLVQNTGKPQVGLMYAAGQVRTYTRQIVMSMCVGVALLWVLIPKFGAAGAFAAIALQHVTLRVLVHYAAARIRDVPFQDELAIFGAILTMTLVWIRESIHLDLRIRLVLFAVCAGGLLLVSSRLRASRTALVAAPPVPVPTE
jgi:O-antigen/teichoic acid export membrane protein